MLKARLSPTAKLHVEAFRWPPIPSKALTAKVARYLGDGLPLSIDRSSGVVAQLERRLQRYFKRKYAVLFSSGTAALHAAYFALGLPARSKIACPVYTYPQRVPALSFSLSNTVPLDSEIESAVRNAMARWLLFCPECDQFFMHSKVLEAQTTLHSPFILIGETPEFPEGGVSLVCPHCKRASLYQQHQLIYRSD